MSTNIVSECSTLKVLYCELAETLLDSFHTALDTHKSCDHEVDSVLLPVIFKATLDSYYIPYHLTQRFMFLIDHIPDQIQRADMGNNISFRNFWALPDTSDITLKIIVNGEVLHEANMNFCDPDAIEQALYILDKPASQTNLTLQ